MGEKGVGKLWVFMEGKDGEKDQYYKNTIKCSPSPIIFVRTLFYHILYWQNKHITTNFNKHITMNFNKHIKISRLLIGKEIKSLS